MRIPRVLASVAEVDQPAIISTPDSLNANFYALDA
jgi:hypothetical protein